MPRSVYTGGYPDWTDRSYYKPTNLLKNPMTYMALLEGFLRGRNEAKAAKKEEERYQQERADRLQSRQEELDWRKSQAEVAAERQAKQDARDEEEYKRKYVGWTDYGGVDPSSVEIPQMSPPQLDMMERQGEKDWRLAIDPSLTGEGGFKPAKFLPDTHYPPTEYKKPKPNVEVVSSEGGLYLVNKDDASVKLLKGSGKKSGGGGDGSGRKKLFNLTDGVYEYDPNTGTHKKVLTPDTEAKKAYEEVNTLAKTLMTQSGEGSLPKATINRILKENGISDIREATYDMFQREARNYVSPYALKALEDYEEQGKDRPLKNTTVDPKTAERLMGRLEERIGKTAPPPPPVAGIPGGGAGQGGMVYLGTHTNRTTGLTDHLWRDTATGKTFKGAPPSQNVSMKTSIPGKNIMGGPQMPVGEGDIDPETLRSLRDATTA